MTVEAEGSTFAAQNTTITGNDVAADDSNGGGGIFSGEDFALRSTIVYGNTTTPPEEQPVETKAPTSVPSDLGSNGGNSFAAGYSLIGTRDGATVNDVSGEPNLSADPQLGALAEQRRSDPDRAPGDDEPRDRHRDRELAHAPISADLARTVDRQPANAADGTDIGAVEIPADPVAAPPTPPGRTDADSRPGYRSSASASR